MAAGTTTTTARRSETNNRASVIDEEAAIVDYDFELIRRPESFEDVANDDGPGSSVWAATFNFSNCIIGAGALGLGGAIARSGGLISIVTIIFFALLVKQSLDLVIALTIEGGFASYEELGTKALGRKGTYLVMLSKFVYSHGCLVAYIVVIQDNLGPALMNLLYTTADKPTSPPSSWLYWLLGHDFWLTWAVSLVVVLPLCLLRDMTPLASASMVSVVSMLSIVGIVIYMWWIGVGDNIMTDGQQSLATDAYAFELDNTPLFVSLLNNNSTASASSFYDHWLEIRWHGWLNNMGTFVFTFVCQHTVHLTYGSLKPGIRTLSTWKKVSTASLSLSCLVSLSIGIFVYMTFWEKTESDIFEIYPGTTLLDFAKLLLCITMLLTFPLPFFTCREILIVFFFPVSNVHQPEGNVDELDQGGTGTLREPLLARRDREENHDCEIPAGDNDDKTDEDQAQDDDEENESAPFASESITVEPIPSMTNSLESIREEAINNALLPGEERQLKLPFHIGFTFKIWFIVTGLAIASPNLGDVLDLVGCVSGTLIAFILPGCFAIQLQGYSHTAGLILVVGSIVGSVGTFFSLKQFFLDTFREDGTDGY